MTYVLKENLQNTTGLLIDETRDTLDTATTSKTADGLRAIDVGSGKAVSMGSRGTGEDEDARAW